MELRVGIGDDYWRSLTFKIWSRGEDVYAVCREIGIEKGSFHKSGITRYAEVNDRPRPSIHSSKLPPLRNDRYCTVGRIFLTTEDNLGPERQRLSGKALPFRHKDGLDCTKITIGFTSCHPRDGIGIDFGKNNVAVEKLAQDKYVTVTAEPGSIADILIGLEKHHYGPMNDSGLLVTHKNHPSDPSLRDTLIYYRSALQTYTMWAHCNRIKDQDNIYYDAIRRALKMTRFFDHTRKIT